MIAKRMLLATCAGSAFLVTPAWSQTTPEPVAGGQTETSNAADQADRSDGDTAPNETSPGHARVEERDIVVTGSRFEKVLSQPQSKAIINAEDRNLAGVGDVRQLIQVQPGFNYTPEFGLNVRGVGRQTPTTLLGAENTVVQYVDGFISLDPVNIAESTLFGGNIQFIRGPAGTRYGRNSLAGSVNLISRAPTSEPTAEVVAGVGRGGFYNIGVNAAGPLSDNLGIRLGVQEFDSPSLATNLGPAPGSPRPGYAYNNLYLEFQLEGSFGPLHFRNRLTRFEYDNQPGYASFDRYRNNLPSGRPAETFTFPTINAQYGFDGPAPSGRLQTNVNFAGYDRLRDNFVDILNADFDLGFASLVYVGGYNQSHAYGSSDYDQTSRTSYNSSTVNPPVIPAPDLGFIGFAPDTIIPTDVRANYDNRNHYWSQELRLEGRAGGRLDWTLGGYYLNQHFNQRYFINYFNGGDVLLAPAVSYTDPTPGEPNPDKAVYRQHDIYDIRTTAAFGNVIWDFSDQFRLDAGIRYTWDEKEATTRFRSIYYYPPNSAAIYTDPGQGANPSRNDKGLSGRAAIAWRPNPGSQIYAAYQRGYQASAFTLGQGLPGPDPANPLNIADKEHLDVYEVGGFGTIGQFRFDGSVFYQNFFNQQIPITVRGAPTPTQGGGTVPGPLFAQFTNADKSRIYGAEAQLTWKPNDHSNIVASYTYLNPTFRRFDNVANVVGYCPGAVDTTNGTCDLAGADIPRTPRNKATLYGYYGINLGKIGYIYPGGSVTYQSRYYYDAFNTPASRVPGRTIVGLTLTYRTPAEHLDVTATVSNLFDNEYYDFRALQDVGTNLIGYTTGFGAPRFWTVTARYRF